MVNAKAEFVLFDHRGDPFWPRIRELRDRKPRQHKYALATEAANDFLRNGVFDALTL